MQINPTLPASSPPGFTVPDVPLPPSPALDERTRHDAALLILAVGRGLAPDECAIGCAHQLAPLLEDPLERDEAFAFVAMLAGVLGGAR